MNTIARIRKNGDMFIIGELTESGDKDVSFDTDGNLCTSNFKEVANIPAVSRFLDGMQISGELHEGMIDKPIMDGLELWYDFRDKSNDDEHRDVAQDLSGNGNDGELVNFAFEEGSGYAEGGLRFDGVDDYISLTSYNDEEYTFTWSVVLEPREYIADSMFMTGQSSAHYFRVMNSKLFVSIFAGGQVTAGSIYELKPNVKYHCVFSYDGSTMKVYVDNSLEYERNVGPSYTSPGLRSIGRYTSDSPRPFNGNIRSVKVYNRALTATEVAHNYAIEKERWSI